MLSASGVKKVKNLKARIFIAENLFMTENDFDRPFFYPALMEIIITTDDDWEILSSTIKKHKGLFENIDIVPHKDYNFQFEIYTEYIRAIMGKKAFEQVIKTFIKFIPLYNRKQNTIKKELFQKHCKEKVWFKLLKSDKHNYLFIDPNIGSYFAALYNFEQQKEINIEKNDLYTTFCADLYTNFCADLYFIHYFIPNLEKYKESEASFGNEWMKFHNMELWEIRASVGIRLVNCHSDEILKGLILTQRLTLSNCKHLSETYKLKRLWTLTIENQTITSLAFLKKFRTLQVIEFDNSTIKIENPVYIKKILNTISLDNVRISSLDFLKYIQSIEVLQLWNINSAFSILPIKNISSIKYIEIINCPNVKDIELLTDINYLKNSSVTDVHIVNSTIPDFEYQFGEIKQ